MVLGTSSIWQTTILVTGKWVLVVCSVPKCGHLIQLMLLIVLLLWLLLLPESLGTFCVMKTFCDSNLPENVAKMQIVTHSTCTLGHLEFGNIFVAASCPWEHLALGGNCDRKVILLPGPGILYSIKRMGL